MTDIHISFRHMAQTIANLATDMAKASAAARDVADWAVKLPVCPCCELVQDHDATHTPDCVVGDYERTKK
jgi:hypothetical protein